MSYELRNRGKRQQYVTNSSSDNDSSHSEDPDYVSERPQRWHPIRENSGDEEVGTSEPNQSVQRKPGRPSQNLVVNEGRMNPSAASFRRRGKKTRGRKVWFMYPVVKGESPRTVISWLIDSRAVCEDMEVFGKNTEASALVGRLKRKGILCSCCERIVTVEDFMAHACGPSQQQQLPYGNIFISESRISLLECQIGAWNHKEKVLYCKSNQIELKRNVGDNSDSACIICADGGNLLSCKRCPSAFHHSCLPLEKVSHGDWLCPYCVCKYCGLPADCREELVQCTQCHKKYHLSCTGDDLDQSHNPNFCGCYCRKVSETTDGWIGERVRIGENEFSCSILRPRDIEAALPMGERYKRVVYNSKLALAWSVLHDSFEEVTDHFVNIDVLRSVIFNCGSNLRRLNFEGFFTMILERDDEVISAACLRIHGQKIAEMPFIATANTYRGSGFGRMLMTNIQRLLGTLNVGTLVVPAMDDRELAWLKKFGFSPAEDQVMEELSNLNTLMFAGARRLQKIVTPSVRETSDNDGIDVQVENHQMREDKNEDNQLPMGIDTQAENHLSEDQNRYNRPLMMENHEVIGRTSEDQTGDKQVLMEMDVRVDDQIEDNQVPTATEIEVESHKVKGQKLEDQKRKNPLLIDLNEDVLPEETDSYKLPIDLNKVPPSIDLNLEPPVEEEAPLSFL